MSSWINRLSKEEAIQLVQQYEIDPSAHLDLLRRWLREYVATHPEARKEGEPLEQGTGLEEQDAESKDEMEESEETGSTKASTTLSTMERIKLIDQMRTWGLHFDGIDPLTFLERIEELQAGYGLNHDQLLLDLSECLRAMPCYGIEITGRIGTTFARMSGPISCLRVTRATYDEKYRPAVSVKKPSKRTRSRS